MRMESNRMTEWKEVGNLDIYWHHKPPESMPVTTYFWTVT
jgi:hypothetical protein